VIDDGRGRERECGGLPFADHSDGTVRLVCDGEINFVKAPSIQSRDTRRTWLLACWQVVDRETVRASSIEAFQRRKRKGLRRVALDGIPGQ
jgi:hypothetical protein